MRVSVKRGADSRRIVDLEERHLVTPDKRFDEHIAPYNGLPSTALTATASTSAFLDLITLASTAISRNWPAGYHGLPGTSYSESAFEELQAGLYQIRFVRQ